MKRFSALAICALLLAGPSLLGGASAVASTGAAPARIAVPGHYVVYFNWDGSGYNQGPITLNNDGTGIDPVGGPLTWTNGGSGFTMTLSNGVGGVVADYDGHKTRVGLCSKRLPGTMTNNIGGSGIWYAIRVP